VTPRRVRRPTASRRRADGAPGARPAGRVVATLVLLALTGAMSAGAAACGGSSGAAASPSASPSASLLPSTTAGTAPLAGTVREAAARYWRLIDKGDYAAIAAAGVPGEAPSATAATDDIVHAHVVHMKLLSRGDDGPGSALLQVDVFVDPTKDVGNPTPWGNPKVHQLFMYLQKASQGGWLVKSWGTGP
jgi:hypothetical protein